MKPKAQSTGLIVKQRSPDQPSGEEEAPEGDEQHALEGCAQDLIKAFNSKDIKELAKVLKATHDILHEYVDSDSKESNDYDSLNIKAAEQE